MLNLGAIRYIQRLLGRMGLELHRTRHGFTAWNQLPGGAPQTVLDIGANAGQFACRVLAALPDCVVHSFEPLPHPYAALQVLSERYPNFHCHDFALGERTGAAIIHTGDYTPSSSLLKPAQHLVDSLPQVVPDQDKEIAVIRLDDWAAATEFHLPLFIKMDVQGYELQVMRGGSLTLRQASAILTELSFVELYEGQPLIADIIDALSELGFNLVDIYEVARDPLTGLGFQCDGLFVPKHLIRNSR